MFYIITFTVVCIYLLLSIYNVSVWYIITYISDNIINISLFISIQL